MDRVKAIKVLKPLIDSYVDYANISMKEEDDDIVEALEMAVEALKADVPDTNIGDMISRQMALKICRRYWHPTFNPIMEEIEKLPSAQSDIIHCKDCKHRGEKPIADGRYWCEIHDTFMYYCSDAERRTDERLDK